MAVKYQQMNLSQLRARLQEITCNGNIGIDEHPLAIEALRVDLPHTIQLVSAANRALPQNCFEWALGLSQELTHCVGNWGLTDLHAGSKFVQELITCLVPVSGNGTTEDDLVLYSDEEQMPTHAGLINGTEVISKWGIGHVYQHGRLEVPLSYGDEIHFYRKPLASVVTKRFVEYVRSHPDYMAIDDIQEEFEEKFAHLYPR